MKRLDFKELRKLAEDNQQPVSNVFIAAFIQAYIGELERLLKMLMILCAVVPALMLYAMASGSIHWTVALSVLLLSFGVFAVLFIEHLYCSKGTSFLANVTGLARALCPDKTFMHRADELHITTTEIKESVEKQRD